MEEHLLFCSIASMFCNTVTTGYQIILLHWTKTHCVFVLMVQFDIKLPFFFILDLFNSFHVM